MNMLFEKTFRGKKIFITGHTGFKGSWLTVWLQKTGAEIKGYSLSPEDDESLFDKIKSKLDCESVFSDIRDKEKLESEILKFQPDYIFHLAAKSLVRYSYSYPLETFETNVTGTANVLNSLIKLKKKCSVVIVTTDKVYENKEWIYPYRENDRLGGYDPYSSSKACAELVVNSYRNSFFNSDNYKLHQKAVSTARAGNVIGGGDYSKDRIIPDMVKSLKQNKTLIIRNPDSTRPWQYVLEPLSGYMLLASRLNQQPPEYSGAYNFGPRLDDNLTVEELVRMAIDCFGKGKYKISKNKNEPHEASSLRLDISKSVLELNWKPVLNSNEAVIKTIDWYKSSMNKSQNIFNLTSDYINDFINRIKY